MLRNLHNPDLRKRAADILREFAPAPRKTRSATRSLLVALAVSRRIEADARDDAVIGMLIEHLRDAAFADRARRIADYVGGTDVAS